MIDKSTNDLPPWLGQGVPLYPQIAQECRVSGPALAGPFPAVYPAFVQQMVTPLSFRDREPCYVTEPNNFPLSPGVYDCRLVHSFLGLPLYATTCCAAGSFSSSSGSAGPGIIMNTCCPPSLPTTLYANFLDLGGCGCVTSMVPIFWQPAVQYWIGQKVVCGNNVLQVLLLCNQGGFRCKDFSATLSCGGFGVALPAQTACQCQPFALAWDNIAFLPGSPCCVGNVDLLFTT